MPKMPKIIELTVEIEIQKVSCPGVWLCQDGRVSLTVFALGTSYQTCMLPPVFPLLFKDVFYFKKRFQDSCAVNNICCMLKEETIYCELVQWSDQCPAAGAEVLAQYLGNLNDVLFPPNMCSRDGVDLLMRRSREFPGILSPKIEIATKVRIDEIWNSKNCSVTQNAESVKKCSCSPNSDQDNSRQKQVCHSAQYHRIKCSKKPACCGGRSHSETRSCGSIPIVDDEELKKVGCICGSSNIQSKSPCQVPMSTPINRRRASHRRGSREYSIYNVETPEVESVWRDVTQRANTDDVDDDNRNIRQIHAPNLKSYIDDDDDDDDPIPSQGDDRISKILIESRYIDQERKSSHNQRIERRKPCHRYKITPCVCEICKRYHELFHSNNYQSS